MSYPYQCYQNRKIYAHESLFFKILILLKSKIKTKYKYNHEYEK